MVRLCHSNHQSFRWIILRRNHMSPRPLLPCFNLGASSGTQVPYPWSKKKGTIYSNSESLNHSFLSSKPPLVFEECTYSRYFYNYKCYIQYIDYISMAKTTCPSTIPFWPQHWQTPWAPMQKVRSASPRPAVLPSPRGWHVPRLPEVKCNKPGEKCHHGHPVTGPIKTTPTGNKGVLKEC